MADMTSVIDEPGCYDPEKNGTGDHYLLCETTPTYIRHDFIKKVFCILSLELLFTFGFMLTVYNIEAARFFFVTRPWIIIVSSLFFVVLSLIVAFSRRVAQNKTSATIIITLMTLCMSLFMTGVCVYYYPHEILLAFGLTILITLALTAFAFQTKYDFTSWLPWLLLPIICLLFFGIAVAATGLQTMKIMYSVFGGLAACVYILIDVQAIAGGKMYEWTVDDYLLASICMYSDIITLFLHILRLVSSTR